jgi:hypothetical protein
MAAVVVVDPAGAVLIHQPSPAQQVVLAEVDAERVTPWARVRQLGLTELPILAAVAVLVRHVMVAPPMA